MTGTARRLLSGGLAIVSLALAACDGLSPEPPEFVIRIDSVRTAGAVSGNAALQLRFFGYVGPDGCHSFKEFRVTRSRTDAVITVVGKKISGICTTALVFLRPEPLTISEPVSFPFTVRVHQPDGAVLTQVIQAD